MAEATKTEKRLASRRLNKAFEKAWGPKSKPKPTLPFLWNARSCSAKLSPVERRKHSNGHMTQLPVAPYCSSTYVSIESTCPTSCPWYGAGCYVTSAATVSTNHRLDDAAREMTPDEVIEAEAEKIEMSFGTGLRPGRVPQDGARGGRDLRLHVGGDTPTRKAAKRLAKAAASWRERDGGDVWTYTHRWRELRRSDFGSISALASVETPAQVAEAAKRGFVSAIAVERFPSDKAYDIDGVRVVPCPAQTRHVTCVECRLCLDDDLLRNIGATIGFALHGRDVERARHKLKVINGGKR